MRITLEEIIIARGDIEKVYRAEISVTLWRALRRVETSASSNPLHPDVELRVLPNGDIRNPDIETYIDKATGHRMVRAEEGKGTSVVDAPGIFGHTGWDYVTIPAGTFIPDELIITKDHYMPRKKCWHYSISPNYDMPEWQYLNALDKLAMNAGIKLMVTDNARRR